MSKSQLLDLVWPGVIVEENNLQVQISTLRKLLGPEAIATIPGRGYRWALTQDDSPAPPAREVRHSLPAERDEFVGRSEELHALAKRLEQGERLVTILGMGGTGKTRLVRRYGWTSLGDWPLAQASIFVGGFTLEAAEHVFDLSAYPKSSSARRTMPVKWS